MKIGNGGLVVSSPDVSASRIRSYRNTSEAPFVDLLITWRWYLSGSRFVRVVIMSVFDQLVGQAGPRRFRWSSDVGAANQASTSGVEACIDQFREKAHGGLDILRWCAERSPLDLRDLRPGRVASEDDAGV